MEKDTQRDSTVRFTLLRSVAVLKKRSEMGTRGGQGEGYDKGTRGREIGRVVQKGSRMTVILPPRETHVLQYKYL